MGRFIAITMGFVIVLLFVLIFMILTSQRSDPSTEAVNIALADPNIQASIRNHSGIVSVGNATLPGMHGLSGYFNVKDKPVQVVLTLGDYIGGNRDFFYVDLGQKSVVDYEWYNRLSPPASMDVTIPAGGGWYHLLQGATWSGRMVNGSYEATNGTEKFVFRLEQLEPDGAQVYAVMANETNLYRLMNNTPYEAAAYLDDYTKEPAVMNGTVPLGANWWLNATVERPLIANASSWPAFDRSEQYYLILVNQGKASVNVSLSQEMEAFQQYPSRDGPSG